MSMFWNSFIAAFLGSMYNKYEESKEEGGNEKPLSKTQSKIQMLEEREKARDEAEPTPQFLPGQGSSGRRNPYDR